MRRLYNVGLLDEVIHVELGTRFIIALRQMLPLWSEILATCREHASHCVLVEGHRPQRDMDFDAVSRHGDFLQGLDSPGLRVAFCLYGYEPDALSEQFARVANAGSTRVAFFSDRPAALAWLRARTGRRTN